MPMECPQCGLQQSFRKYWTEAQRKHGSPSVGGRNYCIECYNQGPRPEDWREVSNWLSQITQLSTTHQHNKYEWKHFMVEFLRRMDARTRKDWSYKGLLPIRCPTDYITKDPRCTEFDPRNCCYAVVIMREVPSLPEEMGWTEGASKVLCGDCIESLMGAASAEPHQRGPELEGLANEATWQRANSFFTNYSYAVWRIYRVRTWHDDTVGSMTQHDDLAVHRLVQRVDKCFSACDCFPAQRMIRLSARRMMPLPECDHPSVSVGSFSADRRTPADLRDCAEPEVSVRPLCRRCGFPSTSVCSSCQVVGCGLCIIFSYKSRALLCRPCSSEVSGSSSSGTN